jgi:hypothetical protein
MQEVPTEVAAAATNEVESRISVTAVSEIDDNNSSSYRTRRRIQDEKDQERLLHSQERKQRFLRFTRTTQQKAYRTRNRAVTSPDDTTISDNESTSILIKSFSLKFKISK